MKKLVFILGAGASKDLQYPLGSELKMAVLNALGGNGQLNQMLVHAGNTQDQVNDFAKKLRHAEFDTIDQFLHARDNTKHVRKIGREAIAGVLSGFERTPAMFGGEPHWYRQLLVFLRKTPSLLEEDKLGFITFNYDRSIEHYLYEALTAEDDKYAELLRNGTLSSRRFAHVHGSLGPLPWQAEAQSHPGRNYGDPLDPPTLVAAGARLAMPHDQALALDTASKLLEEAGMIVVLGFGFHSANLPRVNWEDIVQRNSVPILASSYQLPKPRAAELSALPAVRLFPINCRSFMEHFAKHYQAGTVHDWRHGEKAVFA